MAKMLMSRRVVRWAAAVFAAFGVICSADAFVVGFASQAGYVGGMLLAIAFQFALALVWIDGKPIPTRAGNLITKTQNAGAYALTIGVMSLMGWFAILEFGIGLVMGLKSP